MNIAGICEFILGNTFPFAVFVIYGSHWCNVAYTMDPAHNLLSAYGTAPTNALSTAYNSGQAFYNIVMMLISFVFFLGSLRTNVPFAVAIFFLIFLFAFFAAADWKVAYSGGNAGTWPGPHTSFRSLVASALSRPLWGGTWQSSPHVLPPACPAHFPSSISAPRLQTTAKQSNWSTLDQSAFPEQTTHKWS